MQTFAPYTWLHWLCLVAIAAVTGVAVAVRRRRGPQPRPASATERAVGYAYLAWWIGGFLYLRFGPLHDPPTTYPLQMCHWCAAAAAVALITAHPVLRAFVYFCGLALCTQAVITPSLVEGPAQFPFWFFWTAHGMIIGVAIYDVAARGYRPGWRDFAVACTAAVFYVLVVLPVDVVTGWNYGFVGRSKPEVPTIVDLLGAWPLRLVFIVAIAFAAMLMLILPWVIAGRLRFARR